MNNKLTDGMVLEAINGISCGNGGMAYLPCIARALKEDQPVAFPQGADPEVVTRTYLDEMFDSHILARITGPDGVAYRIRGDIV